MSEQRTFLLALTIIVAVTVGGLLWEVTALHVFAKHAGGLRGMIANPRPLDYVTYNYTPNGHYYELWGVYVPTGVTGAMLLSVGVSTTMALKRGQLRRVLGVWGGIILCASAFYCVTVYYYVIAVNAFI